MNLSALTLDPQNLRVHNEESVEQIKASLKRFGQQKPILIDSQNVVRAGNGTLAAARELEWKNIEVVVSDLSEAELRAYAIADNRTAEASHWNEDALSVVLAEMVSEEASTEGLGFSPEEVERLAQIGAFANADEGDDIEIESEGGGGGGAGGRSPDLYPFAVDMSADGYSSLTAAIKSARGRGAGTTVADAVHAISKIAIQHFQETQELQEIPSDD